MASRPRRASCAARSAAAGWRLCSGDVLARLLPQRSARVRATLGGVHGVGHPKPPAWLES